MDLILMYISGRLLCANIENTSSCNDRLFATPFFEHADLIIIDTTIVKSRYICPHEQAEAIRTMLSLNHAAKFTIVSKNQLFGSSEKLNINSADDLIAYIDKLK